MANPIDGDHGELIGSIYDAALDPTAWSGVLERIADRLDAGGSALIMQHRSTALGQGISIRVDPASFGEYFAHFAAVNPLIPASERLRTGAVTTDRDVLPRDQFVRSEYFRGFMQPNDMASMLSLTVLRDGDLHCAFNFCRRPGQEEHGASEVAFARALMPHLQRAFAISSRLSEAEAGLGASALVLDQLACGIVLFDDDAQVLHVNAAAERIAASDDGLTLSRQGVVALGVDLQGAVREAARTGVGGSFRLPRPSGRGAMSALVMPLRRGPGWLPRQPAALLVIGDPDAPAGSLEDRLRVVWGLTRSEASVASLLMTGASPQDVARQLGIGMPTVRQHMSRTFAKTGTSRQAELVHLLFRTVAPLG